MAKDPTDIWAWTHADEERFAAEDGPKKTMIRYYYEFWQQYKSDGDSANLAINQALDIARSTGDLRWQLHLRHWRLQLWLHQNNVKKALPEAVDLLTLATDERVRDVPQRICAYHDIVECYVEMDAAGYYEEIVENSQHILTQLPKRHSCATCARLHIAQAAADAGYVPEAERWLKLCEANITEGRYPELVTSFGNKYEALEKWKEAERYYREAMDIARKRESMPDFMNAVLGLARAKVAQGQSQEAASLLDNVRGNLKYRGSTPQLARLLEVEGHLGHALKNPQLAVSSLTRSGRINLDVGRYRAAALNALSAVEIARASNLKEKESEEALEIAAQAVGYMPPASRDVYERLATLGREPIPAPLEEPGAVPLTPEQEEERHARKELMALEEMFQQNMALGDARGVAIILFRLSRWYYGHKAQRAAVDYLIWNAALERWLKLASEQREDAVSALSGIREELPSGTVDAALEAAAASLPELLKPLLGEQVSPVRWSWLVRCVGQEVRGEPVLEEEPTEKDADGGFNDWLEYNAGTIALMLRFSQKASSKEREQWASALDQQGNAISKQAQEHPVQGEGAEEQLRVTLALIKSLAALSRGSTVEEARALALPPFDGLIDRIEAISKLPIWEMPGFAPLDLMVEQAARDTVRALTRVDEHRKERLRRLAFRLQLMQYDLLDVPEAEELEPISHFLEALRKLLLNDGKRLPKFDEPLPEPFNGLLAATFKSAQAQGVIDNESHPPTHS
ncbi:hypothetical protein KSD_92190 [Ktedonobacter sp. SOSP1-85]|uniref:hypothetical protein n=1 Tax=Ktedonobacter sp. SOSP1-85 TaxID=2778367 RepID=UPI0019160FA2|nr:hypothetical protein [Ktedonobacter sp. SOSP1-85]GHO81448.1 hypothetical protein KSD_92190 [Ktedonobacter sp. SOSP1-85]